VEKLSQNINVADETRLDIMIAGLDPKYRQYIQMKQPQTYSDATHALLLKEAISPPPSDDAMRQLLETVKTIKENQCDENNDHYQRGYYQRFEDQQAVCRRKREVTCYRCQEEGHYARECPTIKNEY